MHDLAHRTAFIRALGVRDRVQVLQHANAHRQVAIHDILAGAREILSLRERTRRRSRSCPRERRPVTPVPSTPNCDAREVAAHGVIALAGRETGPRGGQRPA